MFFFFESETQKRVREDIQKNMDICLENPKKYAQAIEVLTMHVNSSDQKCIQKIVDTIKATIKNEDLQPIRKYQAILLLSDLMKTHNKALGKYVVKKILKRLTILAQHKNGTKEEGDEDRGRDIFGDVASSQQTYSINFLNTLLTALQEWGTTWPKAPDGPYKDFHRQYNQLVMNGVKFPKKRPKQISKSPPPTRNSISPAANNAGRSSSLNKKASQMQVQKPKSKPKGPVKQIKKPLNPELVKQLYEFYDKVRESLAIFYELLESSGIDVLPLLRDIVGELQKSSDQGTELLIKLQGEQSAEAEDRKIQSYFTFMQKMDKDLNIVAKKPQKFETYRTKYLKLGKSCLDLMSQKINKGSTLEKNDSKLEQKPRQEPQGSKKQSYMTSKPQQKKDEPKIKNPNRYLSVTGLNVLGPNPNQFGSGGQNGSVERFGSFGGIEPTDRHRASIPISSPRAQKQANSDKKQKQSKPFPSETQVPSKQQPKEGLPNQKSNPNKVAEKPQQKVSKTQFQKGVSKVENKSEQNLHVTNNFFKEFVVEEKRSITKNEISNPFKDNDSFGAFGKQTAVQNNDNLDFFGKIDSQQKPNIANINARKKLEKQTQEVDIFGPKMKSQLSDGLSAFVKNQNSQLSGNRPQNKLGLERGSRKSLNFDNPFVNDFIDRKSQKKSEANSVEKNVDANPFSSNFLHKSFNFQSGEEDPNKKFETGNFGKITEHKKVESKEAPNPFETSSIKSKMNPFQSINPFQSSGNPFQQDPFQKGSKQSQASKRSQNPFDAESMHRNAPNPFQSSNIRASNPFQNQSRKSENSNRGIDDILEMFKKPSKKQIETVQRQINLKNQVTKKIGDKAVSMNSEQARQSIVFTVDLNQDPEPGIRFSHFQDIPSSKPADNMFDNKANKQQQSSFRLSKFGEVNDPYQPPANLKNTQDFFRPFDFKQPNPSDEKMQRSSSEKNRKEQKITQQPFAAFDFKMQSGANQKRSYENEKTVKSASEDSFNFQQLEKISVLHKDNDTDNVKHVGFDDFIPFGQKILEQKESEKVADIEKKPPIEVSWGDFDSSAKVNQEFFHNGRQQEVNSSASKLLQVDSKIGSKKDLGSASNLQKSYQSNANSGLIKLAKQPTVNPKLQEPAPLFKKGTDWNPLSMIPNLKPPSFVYMIDEKKMKAKKQELEQIKKQYEQKLQVFKLAKQKNDGIRKILMERTSKVEEIISQKGEYIQILKKVKEDNEIKEQQIMGINSRIKKVEDIKARILQKEKKLFEITKSQINTEQQRVSVQRTTSNKWEMFNKSLEMHRNNSYSMTSRFTPQGVSYY